MRVFLDRTARALVDLMIRHSSVEHRMLRDEDVVHRRTTILGAAVRHLASVTGVPPRDPVAAEPFAWVVFPSFTRAAGIAALFDLKLRILAENSGAVTGDRVHREKLEEIANVVVRRFASVSAAEERELVVKLASLRNKVLHVEFDSVTNRVISLGESLGKEPIFGVRLETGQVSKIRGKPLARSPLVGWLLEARQSGALDAAVAQFARGLDLLSRWALSDADAGNEMRERDGVP
jgi:hypothetical protein